MNNEQVYELCAWLAEEIVDTHPNASVIIGVVGCVTGAFEQEALSPIADVVASFGEVALEVMQVGIGE